MKHWTDRQVSNSSLNYPPKDNRRRGVTITFLHGCSNEADHSAVGVGVEECTEEQAGLVCVPSYTYQDVLSIPGKR